MRQNVARVAARRFALRCRPPDDVRRQARSRPPQRKMRAAKRHHGAPAPARRGPRARPKWSGRRRARKRLGLRPPAPARRPRSGSGASEAECPRHGAVQKRPGEIAAGESDGGDQPPCDGGAGRHEVGRIGPPQAAEVEAVTGRQACARQAPAARPKSWRRPGSGGAENRSSRPCFACRMKPARRASRRPELFKARMILCRTADAPADRAPAIDGMIGLSLPQPPSPTTSAPPGPAYAFKASLIGAAHRFELMDEGCRGASPASPGSGGTAISRRSGCRTGRCRCRRAAFAPTSTISMADGCPSFRPRGRPRR